MPPFRGDNQLSAISHCVPDQSVAHDFIVPGIEVWAADYDGLAQISAALAVLDVGTATEEEAVTAINAIVPMA